MLVGSKYLIGICFTQPGGGLPGTLTQHWWGLGFLLPHPPGVMCRCAVWFAYVTTDGDDELMLPLRTYIYELNKLRHVDDFLHLALSRCNHRQPLLKVQPPVY